MAKTSISHVGKNRALACEVKNAIKLDTILKCVCHRLCGFPKYDGIWPLKSLSGCGCPAGTGFSGAVCGASRRGDVHMSILAKNRHHSSRLNSIPEMFTHKFIITRGKEELF